MIGVISKMTLDNFKNKWHNYLSQFRANNLLVPKNHQISPIYVGSNEGQSNAPKDGLLHVPLCPTYSKVNLIISQAHLYHPWSILIISHTLLSHLKFTQMKMIFNWMKINLWFSVCITPRTNLQVMIFSQNIEDHDRTSKQHHNRRALTFEKTPPPR